MALKTFVLENSTTKKKRQADIQAAVREYLKDPKAKVIYDEEGGRPTVESSVKKVYISITRAENVMLLVIYEKPIGIDGEYLPSHLSGESKVDFMMLAERFFAEEEVDYLRDVSREAEAETFIKIWVRKEAYIKAANKNLSEFPNFSVVENGRFVTKLGGISIRLFGIKFPESENYLFAISGIE